MLAESSPLRPMREPFYLCLPLLDLGSDEAGENVRIRAVQALLETDSARSR